MIVLVVVRAAPGLRGHVTRWLTEVAPGVYVGNPSARVREQLWQLVCERIEGGYAVLVRPHRGEQRWVTEAAGKPRVEQVDFDGLMLPRRRRRRRPPSTTSDG